MRKTVLLFLALACLNAAAQDGWTITTSDFKAETYYGDARKAEEYFRPTGLLEEVNPERNRSSAH